MIFIVGTVHQKIVCEIFYAVLKHFQDMGTGKNLKIFLNVFLLELLVGDGFQRLLIRQVAVDSYAFQILLCTIPANLIVGYINF